MKTLLVVGMKKLKIVSFSVLILFSIHVANSQTIDKPSVVEVDMGSDPRISYDTNIDKLKSGDFYRVKIWGVNSILYKVVLDGKDTSVSEPLTFPTFASLPIEGLQKVIAGLGSLGGLVEAMPALKLDTTQKDKAYELMLNRDKYQEEMKLYLQVYAITIKANAPTTEDEARVLLLANKDELTDKLVLLQELKRRQDNLILDVYKHHLNSQVINGEPFGTPSEKEKILINIFELRTSLDKLSDEVSLAYRRYQVAAGGKVIADAIEAKPKLKELDAQIRKSYDEFEPAIAKVKESFNGDNALKLLNLMVVASNKSDTYVSLPRQLTDEQTTLNVQIIPRTESTGLQTYTTQLKFPIDLSRNFWGISSGFYASVPGNQAFSVKTLPAATDTSYQLVDEKPGNVELGFNTMIRRGWYMSKNSFWHIGLGPGVSVADKVRPRMLFGTGAAFGDKHSIVIDLGLITGYYDMRSQVYETGKDYSIAPTIVTTSKLRVGGYFSIGYLFIK
ncbi:MAG: hypothetical protein RH948_01630 [Cyclobacteriaceae bacterium]